MPRDGHIARIRALIGTTELLVPSVAVVIGRAETVLVGRHSDLGQWVIPGGAIEPREKPADAAVREVWEETGLEVELTALRGVFGGGDDHTLRYPNGDVTSYVVTVFDAASIGGALTITAELTEFQWVPRASLGTLDCPRWMRHVFGSEHRYDPPTWKPPGDGH